MHVDAARNREFNDSRTIQQELESALGAVADFNECALLDYPDFFNIGDHVIWLGALRWLAGVRGASIRYASSSFFFSPSRLRRQCPSGPIVFTGGGNLGDYWPAHQLFREKIISQYPGRKIVILPQSVGFKSEASLRRAAAVFNSHPDLTLFVRDLASFEIARRNFTCRTLLAPDMGFALADILTPFAGTKAVKPLLLHTRRDRECPAAPVNCGGYAVRADWCTMSGATAFYQKFARRYPALWGKTPLRKLFAGMPSSAIPGMRLLTGHAMNTAAPELFARSMDFLLKGIRQVNQFEHVITNRLHGHILCVMLGKSNTLLANTYHKNESFYRTWTSGIPYASFGPEKKPGPESFHPSNIFSASPEIPGKETEEAGARGLSAAERRQEAGEVHYG